MPGDNANGRAAITVTRTIEVPTVHGKKLRLARTGERVRVTYTGIRQPVVELEHLHRAVGELGEPAA